MAGRLRDLMQSASNTAAGNVSGPVDLISMLLRYGGVPVPQNAVGGSQWMAERGLTAPVQPGPWQLAGETLGLSAPIVAAAKAPQIARALLQGGENMRAPATLNPQTGAVVYHGSPHKFDAFDSSKIGTGEGAQAYGHGLYLADNPATARSYQEALAKNAKLTLPDGSAVNFGPPPSRSLSYAQNNRGTSAAAIEPWQEALAMNGGNVRKTLSAAKKELAKDADSASRLAALGIPHSDANSKYWGSVVEGLKTKAKGVQYDAGAHLYKVDLPDEHIAKMLDWDKPLSQQPKYVQRRIEKMPGLKMLREEYELALPRQEAARAAQDYGSIDWDSADRIANEIERKWNHGGSGLWNQINKDNGLNVEDSAKQLKKLGIPGIRYLDGGSRGAGSGTSNYVVFPGNENLLQILERNGQPMNSLSSLVKK